MKTNGKNERLKRRYFEYLKEHGQLNIHSIEAEAKAIARYEAHSGWRDFGRYRTELAISFKQHLADQSNIRTGDKLSKATVYSTLAALRKFFTWLSDQPGYRGRITKTAADYFKTSLKDRTAAKISGPDRVPTLEQVHFVIDSMPAGTAVELRDQALMAFTGGENQVFQGHRYDLLPGGWKGRSHRAELGRLSAKDSRFRPERPSLSTCQGGSRRRRELHAPGIQQNLLGQRRSYPNGVPAGVPCCGPPVL